ncbi:MAG: hypothetical protein Q4C98_03705 [Capnocytophaga sp.]|nr:hypothetical protein [Capnocytophaga sp.]
MSTYTFDCYGLEIKNGKTFAFAQDPFPLEQNCDVVAFDRSTLRLWYDDGTKLAAYSPAFDCLYIDSQNLSLTLWISEQNRIDDGYKNGFSAIEIRLMKNELLLSLAKFFAFDKMIHNIF